VIATNGQTFAGTSLFTVADADGDTLTQYDFWDTGVGEGARKVSGTKIFWKTKEFGQAFCKATFLSSSPLTPATESGASRGVRTRFEGHTGPVVNVGGVGSACRDRPRCYCVFPRTALHPELRTHPYPAIGSGEDRRNAVASAGAGLRDQGGDQRHVRDSVEPTCALKGARQ
jgi:hypothetical protein